MLPHCHNFLGQLCAGKYCQRTASRCQYTPGNIAWSKLAIFLHCDHSIKQSLRENILVKVFTVGNIPLAISHDQPQQYFYTIIASWDNYVIGNVPAFIDCNIPLAMFYNRR